MAKFYVQCGPIESILIADSAQQAAMAAIDHSLQSHLWIYDDPGLTASDCRDHLILEALLHLAPQVRVSERGFDRLDAIEIGTPETILAWHKLMVSIQNMFVMAGLPSRSMTMNQSASQAESQSKPR